MKIHHMCYTINSIITHSETKEAYRFLHKNGNLYMIEKSRHNHGDIFKHAGGAIVICDRFCITPMQLYHYYGFFSAQIL